MNNDSTQDPFAQKPPYPGPYEYYGSPATPDFYQGQPPAGQYVPPGASGTPQPPPPGWMPPPPPTPIPPFPIAGQNYYAPPYTPPVPVPPRKKHTVRNIVLGVIVSSLLLCGLLGFIGSRYSGTTQLSTDQLHATATAKVIDQYPSYLPGHGTLALYDPLQHADNWNDSSTGHCVFVNNAYHVRSITSDSEYNCFAEPDNAALKNATDSAFEVQMTIVQGDCGGVDLRVSPSAFTGHHKFYFVSLCQDGNYGIFKYNVSHQGLDNVRDYTYSAAIKQGINQQNTVDVVAMGSTLTVFINGQQVANVQDTSITQGTFGLAASPGRDNITDVLYHDAKVWTF